MTPLPRGYRLGRYQIDGVLSEAGNFCIVYRGAEVGGDGRELAIKEFAPGDKAFRQGMQIQVTPGHREDFDWALRRFADEGRFLATERHPNVVRAVDSFSLNATHYIAMELLAGGSLSDRIRARGAQTMGEVLQWLRPIVTALEDLERRGCSHLDVSPNNIMFRSTGEPVLIDFGFAKLGPKIQSKPSRIIFTDHYSAPEKKTKTSRDLNARSDVYSLAMVINYALTGIEPLDAGDRLTFKDTGAVTEKAARLRSQKAPPSFIALLDKAASYKADLRFGSIRDFSRELERAISDSVTTKKPHQQTPPQSTATSPSAPAAWQGHLRNPKVLLIIISALFFLLLLAIALP